MRKRNRRLAVLLAAAALVADLSILAVLTLRPDPRLPADGEGTHVSDRGQSAEALFAWESAQYEMALEELRFGYAHVRLFMKEQRGRQWLVAEYEGGTTEAVELLGSRHVMGKTWIDPLTMLPAMSERTTRKKTKTRRIATTFDRAACVATTTVEKLYKDRRRTYEIPFTIGLDMPGAMLYARTIDLPAGETASLDVIERDDVYRVDITAVGRETVTVQAGAFRTRVLELAMSKVDGTAGEGGGGEDAPRLARLWVTDDARRLPVKLESGFILGTVRAELISWTPEPEASDQSPPGPS